jgi:hypothetical protein
VSGVRFAARLPGLASGLALAARPAELAEVSGALRVPLTLEGPARTMRGVPARRCDIFTTSGALGVEADRLVVVLAGAAAGYGGGP